MRKWWFAPVCIAAVLIFGLLVYDRLPAQVPIHWNANGVANGTGSRLSAIVLLPAISLGVWLLLLALPRIDPRRESYARFRPTFMLFINLFVLYMTLLQVVILGNALGWSISVSRMILGSVGVLLAAMGNELGRVQPNWFVGIRTPWTLANDEVWRRTHRVGGRIFVVVGLLIFVAAVLLPDVIALLVMSVLLGGATVFLIGYSYLLWRRAAS